MTAEQYTDEIKKICQEMADIAQAVSQLQSVEYKEPFLKWYGGIGGYIQDKIQEKKIGKIIDATLFKTYTLNTLCGEHFEYFIKKAVDFQLDLQKETTNENPDYYDNARLIALAVDNLAKVLHNYCPGIMAEVTPNLLLILKREIAKLDLPTDMQPFKQTNDSQQTSGCLGIFIFLLGLSGGLLYLLIH